MRVRPVWLEGVEPTVMVGIRRSTIELPSAVATAVAARLAVGAVAAELVWRPNVHAAGLRSAAETAITLSTLIGAVILRSRFHQTRRFSDLLLVVAMAAVAVTGFAFEVLPAVADERTGTFGVGGRVGTANCCCGSPTTAVPPARRVTRELRHGARHARDALAGSLARRSPARASSRWRRHRDRRRAVR